MFKGFRGETKTIRSAPASVVGAVASRGAFFLVRLDDWLPALLFEVGIPVQTFLIKLQQPA
jgi:hypothetical protein